MKSIKDIQTELVDEFSIFDDNMTKYEYIIDLGNELPDLDESYKLDENIVKGCQSTVWLVGEKKDDLIYYKADSNTVITKGIIAMLVRVLSGQKAEDIVKADLNFIENINLNALLSSQRSNGLMAMINKMIAYAQSHISTDSPKASVLNVAAKIDSDPSDVEALVIESLKEIYDPEIPTVSIYDLGLIYEVTVYPPLNNVYIKMTVTAPNCPVAESLPIEVKVACEILPEVSEVEVEMTFDPPWEKSMMSEDAMLELGLI